MSLITNSLFLPNIGNVENRMLYLENKIKKQQEVINHLLILNKTASKKKITNLRSTPPIIFSSNFSELSAEQLQVYNHYFGDWNSYYGVDENNNVIRYSFLTNANYPFPQSITWRSNFVTNSFSDMTELEEFTPIKYGYLVINSLSIEGSGDTFYFNVYSTFYVTNNTGSVESQFPSILYLEGGRSNQAYTGSAVVKYNKINDKFFTNIITSGMTLYPYITSTINGDNSSWSYKGISSGLQFEKPPRNVYTYYKFTYVPESNIFQVAVEYYSYSSYNSIAIGNIEQGNLQIINDNTYQTTPIICTNVALIYPYDRKKCDYINDVGSIGETSSFIFTFTINPLNKTMSVESNGNQLTQGFIDSDQLYSLNLPSEWYTPDVYEKFNPPYYYPPPLILPAENDYYSAC